MKISSLVIQSSIQVIWGNLKITKNMCVYWMCFVCTFLGSIQTESSFIMIRLSFTSLLSNWSNALPSALFIFSYRIYSVLFSSNTVFIEEFCCILGEWQFSHTLARHREDNDFHKRWMGSNNMWGKFMVIHCMTSTSHPQIRLAFTGNLLQTMPGQYAVQ